MLPINKKTLCYFSLALLTTVVITELLNPSLSSAGPALRFLGAVGGRGAPAAAARTGTAVAGQEVVQVVTATGSAVRAGTGLARLSPAGRKLASGAIAFTGVYFTLEAFEWIKHRQIAITGTGNIFNLVYNPDGSVTATPVTPPGNIAEVLRESARANGGGTFIVQMDAEGNVIMAKPVTPVSDATVTPPAGPNGPSDDFSISDDQTSVNISQSAGKTLINLVKTGLNSGGTPMSIEYQCMAVKPSDSTALFSALCLAYHSLRASQYLPTNPNELGRLDGFTVVGYPAGPNEMEVEVSGALPVFDRFIRASTGGAKGLGDVFPGVSPNLSVFRIKEKCGDPDTYAAMVTGALFDPSLPAAELERTLPKLRKYCNL